ncbi:hypothetical protein PIB30_046193 [Stylosanthes scabra]|uniref:Uncharacterized protein n=1 Tax=Stylosanthes scabra TaxID=79078 RepID=A0ABU6YI60_9FABA|nr:hypothetical protein [Stylosanthes scabra]
MRSRGGERAGARSALTPELTFDRAVVQVRRAATRALGIEKCMGKAKEGIGSKGFMKRSKK